MKNHKRLYLLVFILLLGCTLSCKKKANNNPFGDAKIATVDYTHLGEIEHYRIVYDISNNVDSIITTGAGTAAGTNSVKTFNYIGSSYIITDVNSGLSTTVDANTSGMILEILVDDTLIMTYNGTQLAELDIKSPSATYPFYIISPTLFTWSGGDVTAMGNQSYVYDLGKSGQPGDAFRIDNFLSWGRSYIKTNHLPTLLLNTADTAEEYFYQFDNAGRISQFTKLVNLSAGTPYDTMTYTYSYY